MTAPDFASSGSVCFISTHLDDVVLSCSHFVAQRPGSVVVTVCAGAPDGPAGPWDRLTTGRPSARDALGLRRHEDAEALDRLGATPMWLDLYDGQYLERTQPGQPTPPRDRGPIVVALAQALDAVGAGVVVAPVGLFHPDHLAVADACLSLAGARAEEFYLYLDMPYAQTFPALMEPRLDPLGSAVVPLPPVPAADPGRKRRAVDAYASQLRWVKTGLSGFEASMTADERYWRVTTP